MNSPCAWDRQENSVSSARKHTACVRVCVSQKSTKFRFHAIFLGSATAEWLSSARIKQYKTPPSLSLTHPLFKWLLTSTETVRAHTHVHVHSDQIIKNRECWCDHERGWTHLCNSHCISLSVYAWHQSVWSMMNEHHSKAACSAKHQFSHPPAKI